MQFVSVIVFVVHDIYGNHDPPVISSKLIIPPLFVYIFNAVHALPDIASHITHHTISSAESVHRFFPSISVL